MAPELGFYRDGQVGRQVDRAGVVLINAVKEQQEQIEQQKEQLNRQQEDQARQAGGVTAQQQQLDAFTKLVCRTHSRAAVCR